MQNANQETGGDLEDRKQELWTEKQVRRILKELDESGEPVAPFARRKGFKAQRLHWWMTRLGWKRTKPLRTGGSAPPPAAPAPPAMPRLVPVRVVPDRAPAVVVRGRRSGSGVVVEVAGRSIRVEADFDAEVLRKVVYLLEEVPSC